MKLTYSRRCILFIEPIAKLATLFCLLPSYSFDKHKLVHEKLFIFYAIIHFATVLSAFGYVFYLRFENIYPYIHPVLIYMDFLRDIVGVTLIFLTTLQSVYKRKQWKALFNSFDILESPEYLDTKFQKEKHLFTNINILFVVNTLLYTIVIASNVLLEGNFFILDMKYNWNYLTQAYTELLHIYLMYNLILAIRNKYQGINDFFGAKSSTTDLIRKIDTAENFYYIMDEVVTLFNYLCGWSMLLVILHRVIIVLYALSAPLAPSYIINGETLKRSPGLLVVNICFSLVSVVMVMICCIDLTKKEPIKLIKSSILLQKKLPVESKEYARLELFKQRVSEILPTFTAAGFFQIDRSTILSVISVITTYFIVVVQFYLSSR